jgi:hypothetical protein
MSVVLTGIVLYCYHFCCIVVQVTPYKAQVELIRDLMKRNGGIAEGDVFHGVEVKSVDGFQGKEKEVILFSAVRSRGIIGFLDDNKRLNVMLTRPKRALIIIGDADTLKQEKYWHLWLQWVTENRLCWDENTQRQLEHSAKSQPNKSRYFTKGQSNASTGSHRHTRVNRSFDADHTPSQQNISFRQTRQTDRTHETQKKGIQQKKGGQWQQKER